MGYNISGIAINKNYENEFESLCNQLGWNLKKGTEIDFETASENWIDDNICNVYFTKNGTLIFIGIEKCEESFKLENDNVLTFALSETSMVFKINYTEKGIEKRSIIEANDERMEDSGKELAVEKESEDTSEIIWNQIEVLLGKRFFDIELEEKVIQYSFNKNIELKKWWKFWK